MIWGIAVGVAQAATPLVFWWLDSATVYALGQAWLLVAGFVGHGLKDLWQHRTHFVANTRWWPPFCMVVDWVVAAIIVIEIAAGMHFR
jgi:hypothetical protein